VKAMSIECVLVYECVCVCVCLRKQVKAKLGKEKRKVGAPTLYVCGSLLHVPSQRKKSQPSPKCRVKANKEKSVASFACPYLKKKE
jgi:hypothetical protein